MSIKLVNKMVNCTKGKLYAGLVKSYPIKILWEVAKIIIQNWNSYSSKGDIKIKSSPNNT